MSSIDRVRYYDGEFLRAFDFSDEQIYHVEMRRRLNRYLHLYGIVQGLTLVADTEAGVGVTQVSVMPGMAIDALGREIYVFQAYPFGNNDINNNRITKPGTYDVWLRYQKNPATPPSSGYGVCNLSNQYTRWDESFNVVLLQSPSSHFSYPGFNADDTDDPTQDNVGVLLGTVLVDPTSATATFSQPQFDPKRCVLLGVIAQTIQTPLSWDATQASTPFSFLNASGVPNSPLSPPASLKIVPNVFADQNLIVGADFILTAPSSSGTTIGFNPQPTGDTSGNVKIAGDLFVQGNIYSPTVTGTTTTWNATSAVVQQLVQQAMPDFVATVTPKSVTVTPTAAQTIGGIFSTTVSINIPSKLVSMSTVVATAGIAGFEFNSPVNPNGVELVITLVKGLPGPGPNQCTVSVTYSVNNIPATLVSPILSFNVSAIAVCFPA